MNRTICESFLKHFVSTPYVSGTAISIEGTRKVLQKVAIDLRPKETRDAKKQKWGQRAFQARGMATT